jgi:hypothetical protein
VARQASRYRGVILLQAIYARAMGDLILSGSMLLFCVVLGFLSAESRPGFSGLRSEAKERWFPHSHND